MGFHALSIYIELVYGMICFWFSFWLFLFSKQVPQNIYFGYEFGYSAPISTTATATATGARDGRIANERTRRASERRRNELPRAREREKEIRNETLNLSELTSAQST